MKQVGPSAYASTNLENFASGVLNVEYVTLRSKGSKLLLCNIEQEQTCLNVGLASTCSGHFYEFCDWKNRSVSDSF